MHNKLVPDRTPTWNNNQETPVGLIFKNPKNLLFSVAKGLVKEQPSETEILQTIIVLLQPNIAETNMALYHRCWQRQSAQSTPLLSPDAQLLTAG